MRRIRVGSRDSRLAVIQSEIVIEAIRRYDPDIELELVTMKTTGDKILDRTLDKVGGKGLFVKELDRALKNGEVDITVHSLKDMPMETDPDLPVIAVSAREEPYDVLVLPEGVQTLDDTKPIGCASARRRIQLAKLFPQAQIAPVRGNLQTRLRKLQEGQYSALVLAAAGLHRLGLDDRVSRRFTAEEILPAAGQGVIAVQARKGFDTDCLRYFADESAMHCARAERAFVRALDGGCSAPVAAFALVQDGIITLKGMYVSEDESEVRFGELAAGIDNAPNEARALAERLRGGL